MKNLLTIVMLVALVALPTKAQTFGGNNSLYSTAPTASFQSTSTMPGSGSVYASQPMLDADGMATYEGAGRPGGGPRKAGAITGEDDGDLPIGDGTWILMLLAVGYAFFIAWRRKVADSEK